MTLSNYFQESWALLLDILIELGFKDETVASNPLITKSFDLQYLVCSEQHFHQRSSWRIQLCFFEDDSSPTGKYTYCYWLWLEQQFGQTIIKVDGTRMQGTHFSGQSRLNLEGMRELTNQLTQANEQYYRQTQSGYRPSRSSLGVDVGVGMPPSMTFAHALHQMYNEFGLTTIERVTPSLINSLNTTSGNATNSSLTDYERVLMSPPADFQPYLDKINELAEDLASTMARVKYTDFMESIGVDENTLLFHWFIRAAGQGLMLYASVCYVHNISFPFRSKMTEERLLEHIHDTDLQNKYAVADTIRELNMTNWQNYAEQMPALRRLPEEVLVELFKETALSCLYSYMAALLMVEGR